MKRSNRLVLLIGIFLAIVAFALIVILLNDPGGPGPSETTRTETTIVVATRDLALGSTILADAVREDPIDIADFPSNGIKLNSLVVGQVVRMNVTAGQAITTDVLSGPSGTIQNIEVPAGYVGMAVQVDQVSGVGTLTKPGDHVDMVVALTGEVFPVVTVNPDDDSITLVAGINGTSTKLLLQGMQVLGTLLPPPPAQTGNNAEAPATDETALTGQQQIVILAVTAQQAEVIKYSQGQASISLVLRSADDFRDPTTKEPLPPETIIPVTTTGITLKTLVDDYGVLIPELVEAVLPEEAPAP